MTNQASEDEQKAIDKIIRFNCPIGCDGDGSYPEMSADGEWEQGQCQWCFEYGMPARAAIQSLIRTEKLKLLAEVRGRVVGENEPEFNTPKPEIGNMARNRLREAQADLLTKLEAEL